MITFKVFKRLPQTRAIQHTSNRDITTCRSEAKLQKTHQRPNLVFQSQLRLSKFLSFAQFLRHFSTSGGSKTFSTSDMITFKPFKRLPQTRNIQRTSNCDITTCRSEAKLQKTHQRPNLVFQSQLRLSKFLSFAQFLRHFSTSGGSKKFSMSDMMMSKIFKRLPQIRAFQRTSNHDRTTDQSFFIDKSFNPPPYAGFGPRFFKLKKTLSSPLTFTNEGYTSRIK